MGEPFRFPDESDNITFLRSHNKNSTTRAYFRNVTLRGIEPRLQP